MELGRITGPHRAYGFAIKKVEGAADCYVIFWTFDRKYSGSRLRFPQHRHRETDYVGAKRFAKKHDLAEPSS
jgi:hypothetical protein